MNSCMASAAPSSSAASSTAAAAASRASTTVAFCAMSDLHPPVLSFPVLQREVDHPVPGLHHFCLSHIHLPLSGAPCPALFILHTVVVFEQPAAAKPAVRVHVAAEAAGRVRALPEGKLPPAFPAKLSIHPAGRVFPAVRKHASAMWAQLCGLPPALRLVAGFGLRYRFAMCSPSVHFVHPFCGLPRFASQASGLRYRFAVSSPSVHFVHP